MAPNEYEVVFFKSKRGIAPVLEFLETLPPHNRSKAAHIIVILTQYGPHIHPPYSKKITSNLWELRTSGANPIRILYTRYKQTYYLLHSFQKKTNQTPAKDTKCALDRIKQLYNI